MPESREGRVEAIGAAIHYKVSGSGPVLLVLPDGDGDADASDGLAAALTGFTVVTYDRRGTPRSPIEDPRETVTLATHADDAARVLIAVTTHAARAFGSGVGAVIGLELAARHPHRVSTLVAFEPPATDAEALDVVALEASHVPIVPATARASVLAGRHRGAEALALRLGTALVVFETDPAVRPAPFAARLDAILHGVTPADGTG
jgi:pimeloyl-ACP methyl ester carboxylesterase